MALVPSVFAQTQTLGQTASGSFYQFLVPDGWQPSDGLVIWNHGFSLSPIETEPDLGPLADYHLSQGYAVAASSYSLIGWALFNTVDDLDQMYDAFSARWDEPAFVLLYGASLGGIVTAQAIEQADLGNVVGAMPFCGAVAGSRAWDGAFDLRLIYDAICDDVPGGAIPGGATGLPFPPDPNFNEVALGVAVNQCTGLPLPPEQRTAEQQARLNQLLAVTGLPEEFVLTDMGFATFGMFDLIYDPQKLGGGLGMTNSNVDYGDAAINASVERFGADPDARRRLLEYYTPSGKVGDVKIVSIHTDKDGLVIVEHESDYAAKVPAKNLTVATVVEDVPSHCGFTEAELVSSWESLRGWVAGFPQPTATTMQATCQGIEAGGLAAGPCRFDPGFVVPPIEDRIRPREICAAGPNTLCLNDDRFRVQVDWQDFEGRQGTGLTMPQTDESGAFWFFNPSNIELVVKVLDGRQLSANWWVFYGSLTNVEFTMTVTDTVTGLQKTYTNDSGDFASVGDTNAF